MNIALLGLITVATVSMTAMLMNVRNGLDAFQATNKGLSNIQTAGLAGATFTANKSNELLSTLAQTIEYSAIHLASLCTNEDGELDLSSEECLEYLYEIEPQLRGYRASKVLDYISDLEDVTNNGINETLEFGFSGANREQKDIDKLHKSFTYTLVNSPMPSPQTKENKNLLASTLLSEQKANELIRPLTTYALREGFLSGGETGAIPNVHIDKKLLESMVEDQNLADFIEFNGALLGLVIDSNSATDIGFDTLANGLEVDITLSDLSKKRQPISPFQKKDEEESAAEKEEQTTPSLENKIITQFSTAQLRVTPIDEEFVPVTVDAELCPDNVTPVDELGRCPCANNPSKLVLNQAECDTIIVDPPGPQNPGPGRPNPPVIGDPCEVFGACAGNDDDIESELFSFGVQTVPTTIHGVIVDPNNPNRISIVNKDSGGFTQLELGVDEQGEHNLNIQIGGVPKNPANRNNNNNRFNFDPQSPDIGSSGTFTNASTADEIPSTGPVLVDTLPRVRKRYGTTENTININGIEIPAGAVIVGTRKKGLTKGRPKNKDFGSFKIYDPETGALLTQTKGSKLGKKKKSQFNFDYTEKGTNIDGVQVFQNLTTNELFQNESGVDNIDAFLNIQADLASTNQFNINLKKNGWQKKLFKNMRQEDISYLRDVLTTEGSNAASLAAFGERDFVDTRAQELHEAAFAQMLALDAEREKVRDLKSRLSNFTGSKKDLKDLKAKIETAKGNRTTLENSFKKDVKNYKKYSKKRKEPKGKKSKAGNNKSLVSSSIKNTQFNTSVSSKILTSKTTSFSAGKHTNLKLNTAKPRVSYSAPVARRTSTVTKVAVRKPTVRKPKAKRKGKRR